MKAIAKSLSFFLLCCFATNNVFAGEIQKSIDSQVWAKFKQALETHDGALFNSVHTDDIVRGWPGQLMIGKDYKEHNKKIFNPNRDLDVKFDLSFEHREAKDDVAIDIGYYRMELKRPGKDTKVNIGKFHVSLRKLDGEWKITQDWDVSEFAGRKLGEEDFKRGELLVIATNS